MYVKPVYLDYAATTPVDPRVAEKMHACLTMDGIFGNPSSLHLYGMLARQEVEQAREEVAAYLQAEPSEIIWTSGATESINLAIKGAAELYQRKGKHIITMKTEHKAVLDTCQHLEKNGYTVTYLLPNSQGLLTIDALTAALRDDTVLVSIMHVNNETGIVQDIAAIAELTASRGILLHVDAAQNPGKVDLDVKKIPVDLISLCAHKAYGPKGVGALYLRKKPRVRVSPLIHGGGHEQGMRSGTLATHQIVGMGEAFRLIRAEGRADAARITQLRDTFLAGLAPISVLKHNVPLEHTVPHILSLRFEGMLAEVIITDLPEVAVSTASACQGKGTEGSYVLRALGLSEEQAKSAIRFSFGRFVTADDVARVVAAFKRVFRV